MRSRVLHRLQQLYCSAHAEGSLVTSLCYSQTCTARSQQTFRKATSLCQTYGNPFHEATTVCRWYATDVPGKAVTFPKRLNLPTSAEAASTLVTGSEASAGPAGGNAVSAEELRKAAQQASSWMFPWERRQMDGSGPLKWYEKVYWIVFVGGLAFLLFANLARRNKEDTEEQKQRKLEREERKRDQARMVMMGANFIATDDDAFEGMSPKEIQEFVGSIAPEASLKDPFEGLSPEEIDEYVAKHKHLIQQ